MRSICFWPVPHRPDPFAKGAAGNRRFRVGGNGNECHPGPKSSWSKLANRRTPASASEAACAAAIGPHIDSQRRNPFIPEWSGKFCRTEFRLEYPRMGFRTRSDLATGLTGVTDCLFVDCRVPVFRGRRRRHVRQIPSRFSKPNRYVAIWPCEGSDADRTPDQRQPD